MTQSNRHLLAREIIARDFTFDNVALHAGCGLLEIRTRQSKSEIHGRNPRHSRHDTGSGPHFSLAAPSLGPTASTAPVHRDTPPVIAMPSHRKPWRINMTATTPAEFRA